MVRILTAVAIAAKTYWPASTAAKMIISLLQKPLSGGRPDIDNAATRFVYPVTGSFCANPPICFRSLVPVEYSIAPEFRKSNDLKTAWFRR